MIKIPEGNFFRITYSIATGRWEIRCRLHYTAWRAALKEHDIDFPEALFYELGGCRRSTLSRY